MYKRQALGFSFQDSMSNFIFATHKTCPAKELFEALRGQHIYVRYFQKDRICLLYTSPIFQLACRDRNRIALESDLLSAAMLGIDNILCLTGDHTKMGDHPQAKPVFDLDSVSLLHSLK